MITVKIVLRRKILKDGKSPLVLRVIKNRKQKLISLKMSCYNSEFKDMQFAKSVPNFKRKNYLVLEYWKRAIEISDKHQFDNFTLEEFEQEFKGNNSEQDVFNFFLEIINELSVSGKIGNARIYRDTYQSLQRFAASEILKFTSVTYKFLEKYESFLRSNGNKDSGISIKMRTLRALINKAIKRGLLDTSIYPFSNYNFNRFKTTSVKSALTKEEYKALFNLDLSSKPHLVDAMNFFKFSFYCRGINFIDMAKLTSSNLEDGKLIYTRSKTQGRFLIKILPVALEIIQYYSGINGSYLLPIVNKEDKTPIEIYNRKQKALIKYNKDLKKLARLAGVEKNLTSYVARHTYATTMKFLGCSMDMISDSMGHSNLDITKIYLKDFDNEVLDDEHEKLMDL